MSITYGFYNSQNGDRKYSADDFSGLFDCLLSDGIFSNHGASFKVEPNGGYQVAVGSGRAWLDGTWTFNDNIFTVNVPSANSSIYYRAHTIVIEVDVKNRVNSIKCLSGDSASDLGSVVYPTITRDTVNGIYQHPLCDILITPGLSAITASQITDRRGDPNGTPFINTILASTSVDPTVSHRNTFRGKYLGSTMTDEQYAMITDGSFKDLYVGDYWENDGIKWRIADIDYLLNTGNPASGGLIKKHHLIIVPDTGFGDPLDLAKLGTLKNGLNGWAELIALHETLYTGDTLDNVFGSYAFDVMSTSDYNVKTFSNPTADSVFKPTVGLEIKSDHLWLLNEPMVFGGFIHASNGSNRFTFHNTQLALFRLKPSFARTGYKYWLRDIADENSLIMVHDSGTSYPANAAASGSTAYYRPMIVLG